MAAVGLFIAACLIAIAFSSPTPESQNVTRNTIFGDEMLEGEIFEDYEAGSQMTRNDAAESAYRLPTTTVPRHYNILWRIDMTSLSMTGDVSIDLVATQDNVNEIVIHCGNDLTIGIHQLQLVTLNIPVTLTRAGQFCRFQLQTGTLQYSATTPVTYTLSITFAGALRTDMYGIYRSWYRNDPTQEAVTYMASTQFQSTSSRDAFPCYDEPSFKATFRVTIRRPSTYTSWFCTLQESSTAVTTDVGYFDDVYHITPLMSTYLLALIVADYSYIRDENTPYKYEVIARESAIQSGQAQYSFDVGKDLLNAMIAHTDYDFYSVSNMKMTQASIPDFSAGAMENWGLLTYREAYLMYDENHTNSWNKQVIAYILSHEIAHMWFGNLVTCEWWDVLWLNEGFARYYQYFLTDWVETDMGFESRFIVEQVHTALLSDSVISAHPLTSSGLSSNDDVSNMFSTISYNKGAAVIRMTEHLLGSNVHTAGLRRYLKEREFQVAEPQHLFTALRTEGDTAGALNYPNFDFDEYYKSWTEQPGHPVLDVVVNHETGQMLITQRRFDINTGYSSQATRYIIPINFASASSPDFSNTKPTHIINGISTTISRGSTGEEWVVLNKQQIGFYRVNYDERTWDIIIAALKNNPEVIHPHNRAQIVNDIFSFARSGLMSYNKAFNLLSFLSEDTAYVPWVAAATGFNWIRNRLVGTPQLERLHIMIAQWASKVMSQLTYYPIQNESFMNSFLRYQLAPMMCNVGVPECTAAAVQQFRDLFENNVEVPVDSRNWVYCNALRQGTEAHFDFLFTRYRNHNVYTEKILLLQTLGCTPHRNALTRFLTAIVEENYIIRPQDYTTAMNSASSGNEVNTQIVFDFIKNNMALVNTAFGNMYTPLSYVTSRLRTHAEVNEFLAWAAENESALGNSYLAIVNSAVLARQSVSWSELVASDMDIFLLEETLEDPADPEEPENPTEIPPPLEEPVEAELEDSATNTYLSTCLIIFALVAKMMI